MSRIVSFVVIVLCTIFIPSIFGKTFLWIPPLHGKAANCFQKQPERVSAQPMPVDFFGMNTYFTAPERYWSDQEQIDSDPSIYRLINLGKQSGTTWGREEIVWSTLQKQGGGEWFDRDVRKRYDKYLLGMAQAGYSIIGVVVTTPPWARVSDCQQRLNTYAGSPQYLPQGQIWCPPAPEYLEGTPNNNDFAYFLKKIVERYDGDGKSDAEGSPRIAVWQIGNEPNHWETWLGTPTEYGNMLRVAYQAIKQADPTALVVTGGLYVLDGQSAALDGCPCHKDGLYFLDQVINNVPAAWNSFDALAIHPYMPDIAPDMVDIFSKVTLWGRIDTTQKWIRERTQQLGGVVRPVWISELGWLTASAALTAEGVDPLSRYRIPPEYRTTASADLTASTLNEDQQASYLVRAHAIAKTLSIQHLNYLQLEDKFDDLAILGGSHPWATSALLRKKSLHYAAKPAYHAYMVMTQQLTGTTFIGMGPLNTYIYDATQTRNPIARYHMRFQRGYELVDVLWQGSTQNVALPLEPGVQRAELFTRDGEKTILVPDASGVHFTVSDQPIYLHQIVPEPTPTPTPTPTMTPTPTPSPTPPPSPTPIPADSYEPDDTCASARTLSVSGTTELHTFHVPADVDWVKCDVVSGTTYLIDAQVPPDSLADVHIELYSGGCQQSATIKQDIADFPEVQLSYHATSSGTIFLKLANHSASVAGTNVQYLVSVRTLPTGVGSDGIIIVAGRGDKSQEQQKHIQAVATDLKQLAFDVGYAQDHIFLLSTDVYSSPLTGSMLGGAITNWAQQKIGPNGMLTIYIIGHSMEDSTQNEAYIYIDKPNQQKITPLFLNAWVNDLEKHRPDIHINIILESSFSGRFVQELSKDGRVVIASAGSSDPAWEIGQRILFSDYLLAELRQGASVQHAFQEALWSVQAMIPWQQPILDDTTGDQAAQRGFHTITTTLSTVVPPYVMQISAPKQVTNNQGDIQATISSTANIKQVLAFVYPPSSQPPTSKGEFVTSSVPTISLTLQDRDAKRYGATYRGFTDRGTYRVVVYAEHDQGMRSRPVSIEIERIAKQQIFLPVIMR